MDSSRITSLHTMTTQGHLIIIGASARAAAQSALRAGYSPWCIDLFADADLKAIAPVKQCPRDQWPLGVLALMKDAPPGPVLFTGAMENHLEVVRILEKQRELLGGSANAMEKLRQPRAVYEALMNWCENRGRNCEWHEAISHVPALHWDDDLNHTMPLRWRAYAQKQVNESSAFLVKPRKSSGGKAIRLWSPQEQVGEDEYLQCSLQGRSLSAVYHANDTSVKLLGISVQIIGDTSCGAPSPFSYVGNVYPAQVSGDVRQQFENAGQAMVQWSGLQGIFGIDAVLPYDVDPHQPLNHNRIHIVDINPRYPASAELMERAQVERAQVERAQVERAQPNRAVLNPTTSWNDDAAEATTENHFISKAIVYARQRNRWTSAVMTDDLHDIADVPEDGAIIEAGQPICTVFAMGEVRELCLASLRDKAQTIYTRLEPL